ncbi:flagellar hook-basal body protein [Desulfofundulus thermosubterraneus]|uniref:Flagellar hook protein FlgE n=1 Tax=Desulfofundulus thermosubterraneus DSM 16057 TaxID=1121432 RepID=A0A1M6FWX8_9FIRM|nr:flagellar hook-basal body complex protein [Desulfofundulus thermosubterraneus]SHJ02109.1 flagellar hook protein FlgE [Desulfofundulus thermosubterraneus DSM 16057]
MIRSLFAGVAGMKNHQIRMDVIGNNISNVNTVGFKSGRANFQDVLYQTLKSAGTSTNPAQVGLGVSLAGISNNMSPGGLQSTGRTLDLAINGEGFFVVVDPNNNNEKFYTRDGVFYIDQNGYIVNANGYRLQGMSSTNTKGDIQISLDSNGDGTVDRVVASLNISNDGKITGKFSDGTDLVFVNSYDQIYLTNFPNQDGLQRTGKNLFKKSVSSGNPIDGKPGSAGYGTIESGYLEMSNVDLTDEFTNMITTQRGYQASARVITVSDTMLEELINLKR